MDRVILHCDCNGFFASVECALNPELRNVPMAVGGSVEARHGIILAKNELAKKYNIQTAETIYSAKKKCPNLVIVPPHHDLYEEYSRRVNEIYFEYTDQVEKFGIDESWLDVTGSQRLFGNGEEIAATLRKRIREEIGITISVGVSFNKVFAKLGSDYKKPDATTVISRDNYKEIVYPLPVGDLLFVGRRTRDALSKLHIETIGDLAESNETKLIKLLGKQGETIYRYARGEDDSPVDPHANDEVKSIGNGMTFRRDLIGEKDILCGISHLSESIAVRMRKKGVKCTVVQVTIKDPDLHSIQRQEKLDSPTNLAKDITEKAMEIIRRSWNMKNPIRMLTVTGGGIVDENASEQISFFDEAKNPKQENLEKTLDKIREKYGKDAVQNANIIKNDIGI
ncbi:MAG: DNA polymerase IV [Ruminococcaceae bacterium]|nr:DNA polymerase IV [Oscillospiraceae bacterium]